MGANNVHILTLENRAGASHAMRCQWNEDENNALRKVPWRARVVYLQGIRWKMDFRTGIAGLSSVVSYQQLHEVLTCSEVGSTKPDQEINKEGLRAIFRMLERADLVKWLKRPQKGLVFQCTLAFSDHSEQKEDNPKTTPRQPQTSNPSEASNRNGSSNTRNPKTTPRQPQQDNPPPESVYPEEEEGAKAPSTIAAATAPSARQKTPYKDILALYREMLPTCEQPLDVEHWTQARKATIRARWNNQLPDIDSWRECFASVARSRFLTGKAEPCNGRKVFRASLFWIAKPENLLKIYEGKYDG